MKVTRKMLEAQVAHLNRNLNRPAEPWTRTDSGFHANIGNFHIASNSPGDGWTRYQLHEMVTEGGGVHQHFSGNNQDMFAYLRGIDDATRLQAFPKVEVK